MECISTSITADSSYVIKLTVFTLTMNYYAPYLHVPAISCLARIGDIYLPLGLNINRRAYHRYCIVFRFGHAIVRRLFTDVISTTLITERPMVV
jgi:hypothetical protein